jgi:hypothetical protein
MRTALNDATKHIIGLRPIPARNALEARSTRATEAVRQGAFEPWEGTLVSGMAAYLETRV